MIISAERAKQIVQLDGWTDDMIEMKLKAIEQTIRAYTNNNFQNRGYRVSGCIRADIFMSEALIPFETGDTIQISESKRNAGLYTVTEVQDLAFTVAERTRDEDNVLATKIEYPADVLTCALNLLAWEKTNRAKVGIQSETLSRHSVTYFNMDGANQIMGYPASLLGCLKPYRKARC